MVLLAVEFAGVIFYLSLRRLYWGEVRRTAVRAGENLSYFVSPLLPPGAVQRAELEYYLGLVLFEGGRMAVLDPSGKLVAATWERSLPGEMREDPLVRAALAGRRAEEFTSSSFRLALPVLREGKTVGAVYVSASLEEARRSLRRVGWILFLAFGGALLLAASLGGVLAGAVIGPVRELTRAVRRLSGGQFPEIPVRSDDEVGELARGFNHLTARLRETLQEITAEREKAEAIVSHLADGVLAVDEKGKVVAANRAAESLLGTVLPGKRMEEVLGKGPAVEALREALESGSPSGERRFDFRGRTLRLNVSPLRTGERWKGAVAVIHDVTEEERLHRLQKEFVANVSHELRTPLGTLRSYLDTLLEGAEEDPELRRRFLRVMDGETERMTRLVNDLLVLSRLDSREEMLSLASLDLGFLVREVAEKFRRRCEEKELLLQVELEGGPFEVQGDGTRLEQVLTNLLTNAIDFTPPGGRITLSVRPDKEGVRVTVRDTGVGIPPEDLPRVFERFYRVDKARSRQFGGTGLGLTIARELVEAHGGEMDISSEPGRGTEVWFRLPRWTGSG